MIVAVFADNCCDPDALFGIQALSFHVLPNIADPALVGGIAETAGDTGYLVSILGIVAVEGIEFLADQAFVISLLPQLQACEGTLVGEAPLVNAVFCIDFIKLGIGNVDEGIAGIGGVQAQGNQQFADLAGILFLDQTCILEKLAGLVNILKFEADSLCPVLAEEYTEVVGTLGGGVVEEEGGTEQAVGVAVGALTQDLGDGGSILDCSDLGPALTPVFGELIEVALVEVIDYFVEVEVVPAQYVGHGVGVDHGADLVIDAFRGQSFDVPVEVEMITEPQGQQVGSVVICTGLDVGQSNGDFYLFIVGLAAFVKLVDRSKECFTVSTFDFQVGLVFYGLGAGDAHNQSQQDEQERLHSFHGIASFYFCHSNTFE